MAIEEPADRRELAEALRLLANGDHASASAACQRLLKRAPRDAALHQLAAAVGLRSDDFAAARRWADSSLAIRPEHVPTLMIAGRAARGAGDREASLGHFRRAATLAPEYGEAAFMVCVGLLELGDPQAQAALQKCQRDFPGDAGGWRAVGHALLKAGRSEAALVAFMRVAGAEPSCAAHLRCGAILQSLDRFATAAEAFRAAQALAPDCVEAALELGVCLRRCGDFEGAAAALEHAVALDSKSGRAWFMLGLLQQDRRNWPAAIAAYQRALQAQPSLAEAAVNLGAAHQETGDMEAAKAAYREALKLRPDTFGRIAQALAAAPTGELWLDLAALRQSLAA
jgi:tetratricopeptide (TPR) repeat protein